MEILIDHALKLAQDIKTLEGQLDRKRTELRAALGVATAPEKAKPAQKKKAKRARKPARQDVNVSQTVLAYLEGLVRVPKQVGEVRVSSATVPTIVADLGLKGREEAVRSALKKHAAANRAVNVGGRWELAVGQKKAPEPVKVGGGLPTLSMEEPPSSWVGDSYRRG